MFTCIGDKLVDGVSLEVVVVGWVVFAPDKDTNIYGWYRRWWKLNLMDSILWSRGLAFPFQLVMMALNQEAHCTVTLRHFKRTLRDCWTTRERQTCSPKSCEIGLVKRIEVVLISIIILQYVHRYKSGLLAWFQFSFIPSLGHRIVRLDPFLGPFCRWRHCWLGPCWFHCWLLCPLGNDLGCLTLPDNWCLGCLFGPAGRCWFGCFLLPKWVLRRLFSPAGDRVMTHTWARGLIKLFHVTAQITTQQYQIS